MGRVKTQPEWLSLNMEILIQAIKEDGRLDGPKSRPLLMKMAQYSEGLKTAKYMLKQRLSMEGLEHLLPSAD